MKSGYKFAGLSLLGCMLVAMATGCSSDVDEPVIPEVTGPVAETAEVPITVSLSEGWSVDVDETRAAPPTAGGGSVEGLDGEAETEGVDMVHFVVFRRKAPAENAVNVPTDGSDFFYDPTNDQYAEITSVKEDGSDVLGTGHTHRVAKGTLKKVYGYEYRVVAIAYSTKAETNFKGADSLDLLGQSTGLELQNPVTNVLLRNQVGDQYRFTIPTDLGSALSYDKFEASILTYDLKREVTPGNYMSHWGYFSNMSGAERKLLSSYILQVPQLFFAECVSVNWKGESNEVIQFAEEGKDGDMDKKLPLSGILFRGVAKVELHITPVSRMVTSLSESQVTGITLMADRVFAKVGLHSYDDFLAPYGMIVGQKVDAFDNNGDKYTPLAHAKVEKTDGNYKEEILTAYLLPGRTRLAVRVRETQMYNADFNRDARLTGDNVDVAGENGTGIVSPDLHDDYFYIRRNHKYVIRVNNSLNLLNSKNCSGLDVK